MSKSETVSRNRGNPARHTVDRFGPCQGDSTDRSERNAGKALAWGLINAVAEPKEFNEKVAKMASVLADRRSLMVLSEEASEGITAMIYR